MIKRFTHGPKILVDMGNEILDIVEKHSVKPGSGVRVKQSAGGQILDVISSGFTPPHAYAVYDASSGSSPYFSVTPGNHYDSTGGATWIPTLGGTAINVIPAPKLAATTGDLYVYFKATVNPLDGSGATPAGAFTAFEIDVGVSIPANTNTTVYELVDGITVTVTGGIAKVVPQNMGVTGVVTAQACGSTVLFYPQSS